MTSMKVIQFSLSLTGVIVSLYLCKESVHIWCCNSLTGVIVSLYLLLSDTILNCNACTFSFLPFPRWIPALSGLVWFSLALADVYLQNILGSLLAISGIAGILTLSAISLKYNYFCPLCITAWAIGLGIIFVLQQNNKKDIK